MTEKKEISLDGISVVIGMPTTRDVPAYTVRSLLGSQAICKEHGVPFGFALVAGNAIIQWARDEVIHQFLESDATRLFMIDSDIIWNPSDFMRLLALTTVYDVVCASYSSKTVEGNIVILHDEEKGLKQDDMGMIEIFGAGLGFTVVKREVIEALVEKHGTVYDEMSAKDIPSVFRLGRTADGKRVGEDIAFFDDIRELGYKVMLDPSINLQHFGAKCYEASVMNAISNL